MTKIDELMREVWQMRLAADLEAQAKRIRAALEAELVQGNPTTKKRTITYICPVCAASLEVKQ